MVNCQTHTGSWCGGSSGCDDDDGGDDGADVVEVVWCGMVAAAWTSRSSRSGGGKRFGARPEYSPENISGGGGGRNPAVAAGKSERE
ncbi:hypothetical protein Tco_1269530 [Tanacetum coccineum]